MVEVISIVDLFAGAGGASTGMLQAVKRAGYGVQLKTINHNQAAVDTHTINHPGQVHYCCGVDDIRPGMRDAASDHRLLWASPECTQDSPARSGKLAINDSRRVTAYCVPRWAEMFRPNVILVENVPAYRDWGPINDAGRPIKSRKGEAFLAWLNSIKALGYSVDHRVLCAADYGVPTTRQRLIIQAVRGDRKIVWPEPTHAEYAKMHPGKLDWLTARSCIDWTDTGRDILSGKKPVAKKTMARVRFGLKKFGMEKVCDVLDGRDTVPSLFGLSLTPFLIKYYGTGSAVSVDRPLDTVTCKGRFALVQPQLEQAGYVGRHAVTLRLYLRMLQPRELARAQGFPDDYILPQGKIEAIQQIGNAVPVGLAAALTTAVLPQIMWAP